MIAYHIGDDEEPVYNMTDSTHGTEAVYDHLSPSYAVVVLGL